jgi:hypothetical protein
MIGKLIELNTLYFAVNVSCDNLDGHRTDFDSLDHVTYIFI